MQYACSVLVHGANNATVQYPTELCVTVLYCQCVVLFRPVVHCTDASDWPLLLQVAYHASRALLQYIRAHLVIHLTALQRRLRDGPVGFAETVSGIAFCLLAWASFEVVGLCIALL
jgi:hypothetical protein